MKTIKALAIDCGLPESADIVNRLREFGIQTLFPDDGRRALLGLADASPDFIILMLKGAPGKWLYRLRQVTLTTPIVLLCDETTSPSDILQMVAAGASSVLKADVSCDLILSAFRLAASGYLVAPVPFGHKSESDIPLERMQLTVREVEILEHVAQGKTNAEIAKELFLAEVTVRNHLANIFKKTGFKNRTSAGVAFTLANRLTGDKR